MIWHHKNILTVFKHEEAWAAVMMRSDLINKDISPGHLKYLFNNTKIEL